MYQRFINQTHQSTCSENPQLYFTSAKSTMKAAVKARCCQGDATPSHGTAKSLSGYAAQSNL